MIGTYSRKGYTKPEPQQYSRKGTVRSRRK